MAKISVYTDGAASNNGYDNAIGGWAFIIIEENGVILKGSGQEKGATNQQMELMAALKACEMLFTHTTIASLDETSVDIYSDSAYLVNCYKQEWWKNWKNNGWKNAKKQPVANKEIWEQLIPYFKGPWVNFIKVKGHNGNKWNEEVDKLAVAARLQ